MRVARVLLLVTLAALGGCGSEPTSTMAAAAPAAATTEPAADGFCAEHGVLEAVCTKCNPALIPVFQAKNDWCAEHGFPESICPVCHPERGGKPAVDVSTPADGGPAEGTRVKFKTPETARLAGIETAKVQEVDQTVTVSVTATILYDGTRVAAVNARSGGVVKAIKADVGAQVRAGDALAKVESADVGADRSRHKAARARAEMAETAWQRQKELHAKGIAPYKEVIAAQREWDDAQAELSSVEASLRLVGGASETTPIYMVLAPLPGVVTQRHTTVGTLVEAGQPLFEVVDTSSMWAELDIPEDELAGVAAGQEVTIEATNLPGRTWRGAIQYIAPTIDPRTRTVKARVPVENPDGALRSNMYTNARIAVRGVRHVAVPVAAVQQAKGVDIAFVRLDDDEYETRRVEALLRDGDRIVLARGLKAGEDVVTKGSFFLMTETLKDSIGAGCCDVD